LGTARAPVLLKDKLGTNSEQRTGHYAGTVTGASIGLRACGSIAVCGYFCMVAA